MRTILMAIAALVCAACAVSEAPTALTCATVTCSYPGTSCFMVNGTPTCRVRCGGAPGDSCDPALVCVVYGSGAAACGTPCGEAGGSIATCVAPDTCQASAEADGGFSFFCGSADAGASVVDAGPMCGVAEIPVNGTCAQVCSSDASCSGGKLCKTLPINGMQVKVCSF